MITIILWLLAKCVTCNKLPSRVYKFIVPFLMLGEIAMIIIGALLRFNGWLTVLCIGVAAVSSTWSCFCLFSCLFVVGLGRRKEKKEENQPPGILEHVIDVNTQNEIHLTIDAMHKIMTRSPEDICKLCLDPLSDPKTETVLRCGHMYHKACFDQAMKDSIAEGIFKCPSCEFTKEKKEDFF